MEKLNAAIELHNATNRKFQDDGDDYNTLVTLGKATTEQIARLEELVGPLPEELKQFYLKVGGLENTNNGEIHCMDMLTAEALIEGVTHTTSYYKMHSLGLADMMRYNWGNDRPEFTNGRFFTPECLQYINSHYRCFGWYRTDDGLEAAYYMYFDQAGKFGALLYHQDTIDRVQDAFRKMMVASPATQTLEDTLCEGIEKIRATLIEWNADDDDYEDEENA